MQTTKIWVDKSHHRKQIVFSLSLSLNGMPSFIYIQFLIIRELDQLKNKCLTLTYLCLCYASSYQQHSQNNSNNVLNAVQENIYMYTLSYISTHMYRQSVDGGMCLVFSKYFKDQIIFLVRNH